MEGAAKYIRGLIQEIQALEPFDWSRVTFEDADLNEY
jgi:hypothetical protein